MSFLMDYFWSTILKHVKEHGVPGVYLLQLTSPFLHGIRPRDGWKNCNLGGSSSAAFPKRVSPVVPSRGFLSVLFFSFFFDYSSATREGAFSSSL